MPSDFERYAAEINDGLGLGVEIVTSVTEFGTPEKWEKPIPLEVQLPPFPVQSLPGPMADFVEALSVSTQTPPEMAGVLALGVLATAFQGKHTVEITPDWVEPLCLYCVAVAPPGERKSSVLAALMAPVYEQERVQRELMERDVARSRTERELLEGQLAAAKKKGEKGREDALKLTDQLAQFQDVYPPRLVCDDVTPEKLTDLMAQQGGSMTVCSAEGGVFDGMLGRYDRGNNFDVYLKAHAGDHLAVDRLGRAGNYIPHPRLTMVLAVQPDVVRGAMSRPTLKGRGLTARFLYAMCRGKLGSRSVDPPAIPPQVQQGYQRFTLGILEARSSGPLHLSPEAQRLRKQFQQQVEGMLIDELEALQDWGSKLTGAVVRIAGLLHAAGQSNSLEVQADEMAKAIALGRFFIPHAQAAYQAMGADTAAEDAKYIWGKVRQRGQKELSRRDLLRICRRFQRDEELEPGLALLIDRGYIQPQPTPTGARQTLKLLFNPLVL